LRQSFIPVGTRHGSVEGWKVNTRCWFCNVSEGSHFGNSCCAWMALRFHTIWAVCFTLL